KAEDFKKRKRITAPKRLSEKMITTAIVEFIHRLLYVLVHLLCLGHTNGRYMYAALPVNAAECPRRQYRRCSFVSAFEIKREITVLKIHRCLLKVIQAASSAIRSRSTWVGSS